MEIERRFWIDGYPTGLPLVTEAVMYQGYISTAPVVRIRSTETEKGTVYVLCFKGNGTLAREEIENEISGGFFHRLCAFVGLPLIRKDFKAYALPSGHILECSLVDAGAETEFFYAEVEFNSIEEANAFTPPAFLGEEITEDKRFSMVQYWKKKYDL